MFLSQIKTRRGYDFLLYFPHEYLTSFLSYVNVMLASLCIITKRKRYFRKCPASSTASKIQDRKKWQTILCMSRNDTNSTLLSIGKNRVSVPTVEILRPMTHGSTFVGQHICWQEMYDVERI